MCQAKFGLLSLLMVPAFAAACTEQLPEKHGAPVLQASTIRTERLILRPWNQSDFEPCARMNADPRVMEHFPAVLSTNESDDSARQIQLELEAQGWGLWVVEIPGVAQFAGFIGLRKVPFVSHFTPAVEIGWRLAPEFWGKGFATEGAKAALRYGFETLKLSEIVSVTNVNNVRSRNVMQKLGMKRNPDDDFDNPERPEGPFKRHVLYRMSLDEWPKQVD